LEKKCQSMQWNHQCHQDQKRHACHEPKWRQCFFFYVKGIVHFQFLQQGRTVNQHCYLEILVGLHEAVHRRRPELGLMLGSCIMTMPLLMMCSLSGSFW
jgi:hypothetical protein